MTVMVWVAVAVLLQLSVAVQVRVMVPQPSTTLFTSGKLTVIVGSQLSVAVTLAAVGTAAQSTVTLAGTPAKTGAVLSVTVIVWVAVAVLLQLSVAVQVRVMVPQPSTTLFTSGKLTVIVGSQLSVAVTLAAVGTAAQSTVTLAGTPAKTGAVLSVTVIVWVAVAVLLQLSVAVQVRVMVPQPSTTLFTSGKLTVIVGSQLSVAVTLAAVGTAAQSTVTLAGTPAKTGAVLSVTVIVWVAVAVLLQLSVAVQVRVIVPQPSTTLFTSVKLTVIDGSQLSVAVTLAAVGIAAQSTVILAGTPAKTGAVLSVTVMVWVAVAVLLQLSVAVQVRVIVPQPSTTLFTSVKVTVIVGSQLSVAVTLAAVGTAAQSTVVLAGTPAKTGAVLSVTVIVWVAVAVLPQLSVAVQVRVMVPQPSTTLFTSVKLTVIVGSQLSVAVTLAAVGTAAQSTVVLAGTPTSVGAVRS